MNSMGHLTGRFTTNLTTFFTNHSIKAAIGLLLGLGSSTVTAEVTLNFGLYTSDKATTVVAQFRPLLSKLESKLSETLNEPVSIHTRISPTYEQAINKLVDGEVDFARFGPASYVLAKDRNPAVTLIAMESKKGKKMRSGYIIAHAESPIQHMSELNGKRFAFGSDKSTIGRYFAQLLLAESGVHEKDLQGYDYLGRHDKVGEAVARGDYDAGALKSSTFKKLVKKGRAIRILKEFTLATKAWAVREGLSDRVQQALTQTLLQFDDKDALKVLKKDGFVAADDAAYGSVRKAIHNSDAFFR